MKKTFVIAICFYLALLSWIHFDVYSTNEFRQIININGTYVDLENMRDISKSNAIQIIQEAAESTDVIVVKREFKNYLKSKEQNRLIDVTLYTSDYQAVESKINQRGITSTVEKTPFHSQAIILDTFDRRYSITVYPLNSLMNGAINGEYIIIGTNVVGFTNQLSKHNIICNVQKEGFSNDSSVFLDLGNKLTILCICFIIIAFWGLIIISGNLKLFSVKHLLGHGTVRIINKVLLDDILCPYLIATLMVTIVNIGFLLLYNAGYQLLRYVRDFLFLSVAEGVLIFVIFFILVFALIKMSDLIGNLKNHKSNKLIICANTITKFFVAFFAIHYVFNALTIVPITQAMRRNDDKWTMLSSYSEFGTYINLSSYESQYRLGQKCKEYFAEENDKGAILIRPSSYLSMPKELQQQILTTNEVWTRNNIEVNNNYLQLIKIYDAEGNLVDYSDYEDSENIIVLVPEKYKSHHDEIHTQYEKLYTWQYYVDQEAYLEELGELPPQKTERHIQIAYVKNDQNYFSFLPYQALETQNHFVDPLVTIINNKNTGGDTYLSAFSMGQIKVKNTDYADLGDYYVNLQKYGLEDYMIEMENSYDKFTDLSYRLNQIQNELSTICVFLALLLLIVSIYSVLVFYKISSQKLILQMLYGHSCIGMSKEYLGLESAFWLVTAFLFAYVLHFQILISILVVVVLFVIEILLSIGITNYYVYYALKKEWD